MEETIRLLYDKEADVLYVTSGTPEYTDYEELGENLIVRRDPKTEEIVGFTVMDFVARFAQEAPPLSVPLQARFERVGNGRKTKVAAEKRATYRVKRGVKR